jgi:branched-chain amino acid transport system substrate-binding protein
MEGNRALSELLMNTSALISKEKTVNTKLKVMTAAISAAIAMGLTAPAHAQISGDVVKIGFITDLSGNYADADGKGGVEAIKMAIADFGGAVNGKKIEVLTLDHQNKADIASSKSREWYDQGVDVIIAGPNSSVALAIAKVASDKKKPFISIGATSSRLTNEDCTPYTVHYAYDTVSLAKGTGSAVVKQGGKTWYFLTADYAFGTSIEKDTTEIIKANGGTVLGSARHPLAAADFSAFLLQAGASKAQILGLANAGGDTINSIKAAHEFGIYKKMKIVALNMYITDVHALGLNVAQNMYLTDGWYWDLNKDTRAWAKRYMSTMKSAPTLLHAADYSAVTQFLNAVKATGSDDGDKIMAHLKSHKINDMFAKNGVVRPDGRMVHDMYLMQVKTPAESKYPWDYYKVAQTIPGDEAFTTKAESRCALWK